MTTHFLLSRLFYGIFYEYDAIKHDHDQFSYDKCNCVKIYLKVNMEYDRCTCMGHYQRKMFVFLFYQQWFDLFSIYLSTFNYNHFWAKSHYSTVAFKRYLKWINHQRHLGPWMIKGNKIINHDKIGISFFSKNCK